MIGRIAAALAAYLLCVFHFSNDMITVGHVFGITGFWALFVPATMIALSVYKIADADDWGLWDAVGFLIIGGIAMVAMTNDPRATFIQMMKGVLGFGIAGVLAGLSMRGRKTT